MASGAPRLAPHLGARVAIELGECEPVDIARRFEAAYDDVVWLDSADGGVHVIGTGAKRLPAGGDPVGALQAAVRADPGPWVGWFGYEAGVRALGLPPHPSRWPDSAWLLLDEWVVIDEHASRAQLQARAATKPTLPPSVAPPPTPAAASGPLELRWRDSDDAYLAAIERCISHIRDGDSYLMCLTTAVETAPIDAFASYLRLRQVNPAHHGGFVRIGGVALASASPEVFLHIADGRVRTKPIKGTRARLAGDADAEAVVALRASEKERAENLMIVDLCRNDLQRVCVPGTVEVSSLFAVESYKTVHQLVSTVEGVMQPGVGVLDVVRATFPAGSMTGAPKRRTVELLQDIEGTARGVYSGCFGMLSAAGADLAMVIRSIVADDQGASIGVGGGITALSDPAFELSEVKLKAAASLAALVPRYEVASTDSA